MAHSYGRAERASRLMSEGEAQSGNEKNQKMLCRRHYVPQVPAELREAARRPPSDSLNRCTYLEGDWWRQSKAIAAVLAVSSLQCVHCPPQSAMVWGRRTCGF